MDQSKDMDETFSKYNRRGFFKSFVAGGIGVSSVVAAETETEDAVNDKSPKPPKPPKFEPYVREQLALLNDRTADSGPIQSDISELRRRLQELQSQIDSCTTVVGSPSDIASVQQSLREIKQALNIP